MEHYSHPMDLPVSEMHMQMIGQVSSSPESHLYYAPMPISNNTMFNTTMVPTNAVGHNESSHGSMGPSPIYFTDQLSSYASMMNNETDERIPLPVKRKAELGPLVSNSVSPRSLLPNKRPVHMGSDVSSAGFLQLQSSAPQRKNAPAQSRFGSPGVPVQSMPTKKMVRNDSTSGKSGLQRGQSAKRQTTQIDSSSKVRTESSEAVRSKMRESLAGALALAVQKQDNVSITEKTQSEATIAHTIDSQASEAENSKDLSAFCTTNESQVFSAELLPNGSSGTGGESFQGFQYSSILPDDGTFGNTFFAKDDLLQGNGLSWDFAFDAQMVEEGKEAQHDKNLKPMKEEEAKEVPVLTPENLAFQIEAELFKLFGGVNKKYREKARSLLFNLKDRNNPDLRESVMSGEISPERLCSMSAEELASKELSQWRMAKAEEFAQMVVLPDTDVDVRRLVKKTHKGEYQVEVDNNDDIAAEVSSGTSMMTLAQPKKVTVPQSPSKPSPKDSERVVGQGSISEDQDFSGSLIIPTDGTDLMQGMIVDELKDAEFLPPIVSLDEFMESLNNEPPFEDLSGDARLMEPTPHGETPKSVRNSRGAFNRASDSPKDANYKKGSVINKHDVTAKSSGSPAKTHDLPSSIKPKVECIWSGTLQLHISSSVTVRGLFQSGEKMSTKEWPTSLEIKGRVRLDAFEKFLQELPMSRTRAVMVLMYELNDSSSEIQRANLSEAISSYTKDERLGYAEPAPGVELYICPTTPRISEMLNKLAPKEKPETNNTSNNVENGLMGVVVWRRAHISKNTISPNTTSHHKHASKKQPFAPPQRVHNVNVNNNSNPSSMIPLPGFNNNRRVPEKEEDEDIPPGFGPGVVARKDYDDLPEFNFAKPALNHPLMTQRPVDQVRELIKKYGQGGSSVNSMDIGEPWEEDDDIPEWRPQGLLVHLPMVNRQQPNGGVGQLGRGGRWVQPPGPQWRQY